MKWTLLVCAVVLLSPLLFLGLLMAKNIVNALVSPTRNSVRHTPAPNDLAGLYVSIDKAAKGARIDLRADRTATVHAIEGFDGFGQSLNCVWDGEGTWNLWKESDLSVKMIKREAQPDRKACSDEWMSFTILEQSAPYYLFMYIGDPDEGNGYTFRRSSGIASTSDRKND